MNRPLAATLSLLALVGCTRTGDQSSPASSSSTTSATPASQTTVTVKGSDTMVILGQRWAETYMKANAGLVIQVTGGGSGTGIAALINGQTDVCESSRPMTDPEKGDVQSKRGAAAVETKVALDALAVYVNAKNPVDTI